MRVLKKTTNLEIRMKEHSKSLKDNNKTIGLSEHCINCHFPDMSNQKFCITVTKGDSWIFLNNGK